jgi:hypothetical protein
MASDAILDVCTYHPDFDLVLIRSLLDETQAVVRSLQTAFKSPTPSSPGLLDQLPIELLLMVFRNLDVQSYFRFRHVNRKARAACTAVPEYQAIAKYGLEGLRGMLRAGLAQTVTIGDLYKSLIRETCEVCDRFGGFLFLPTATRCCFDCIRTAPDLRVISTSTLSMLTRKSTKRLFRLLGPELRTVPGSYSTEDNPSRRPKGLMPAKLATAKSHALGIRDRPAFQELLRRSDQESHRFMASTAFPWYDLENNKVESGVSCKGCRVPVEDPRSPSAAQDLVFSRSGYLSHFSACKEAQSLWERSEGEARPTKESGLTQRCDYISELDSDEQPR